MCHSDTAQLFIGIFFICVFIVLFVGAISATLLIANIAWKDIVKPFFRKDDGL